MLPFEAAAVLVAIIVEAHARHRFAPR